jgi:kynureninase
VHDHAHALQALFLRAIADMNHPVVNPANLTVGDPARRGNFLAFRHEDASALAARLAGDGVLADARGPIIRFGFGCYHSGGDVARLVDILHAGRNG